MGKGQFVSAWYMGMREGSPWPIIAMNVGVGSSSSSFVLMEVLRDRTYSWQFCAREY
jgi:hypothetical protein